MSLFPPSTSGVGRLEIQDLGGTGILRECNIIIIAAEVSEWHLGPMEQDRGQFFWFVWPGGGVHDIKFMTPFLLVLLETNKPTAVIFEWSDRLKVCYITDATQSCEK